MSKTFKVGITNDFLSADGKLTFEYIGLDILDAEPNLEYEVMAPHPGTLKPEHVDQYDAILSLTPKYTEETFQGIKRFQLISRFGVGYDMVDPQVCTDANVMLCITNGAVNHSMAEATITWMLALSHRVFLKDRLVRNSRWGDKVHHMGTELRDRRLGVIGLGEIGQALVKMLRAFGMNKPMAYDPYLPPDQAADLGVELVSLEELLKESDFVSVNCPLTDGTLNLIGKDQLALMKSSAFLINTARGGIVQEEALVSALKTGQISGAATDVFENEPADAEHPLAKLDNVILAPHAIGWTDELFRGIGTMACQAIVSVARGETPKGLVNQEVINKQELQEKLVRSCDEKPS